jgi:hypothetical protein
MTEFPAVFARNRTFVVLMPGAIARRAPDRIEPMRLATGTLRGRRW